MNILILYSDFGAGHLFSAKQLKDILKNKFPNSKIYLENTKKKSAPFMTKLIEDVYMNFFTKYGSFFIVKKLYGFIFYVVNSVKFINVNWVQKTGSKKALDFIKNNNIDIVVCTYPYKLATKVPTLICITDYKNFPVWVTKKKDIYLVNDLNEMKCFEKRQIPNQNIFYSKINLDERFTISNNSNEIQSILFNLGARGQVKYWHLCKSIDQLINFGLNVSVMCGGNSKLYKQLNEKYSSKITTYPFVKNVYDIIAQNDVVVTKAGGITISECIQSERPIIVNLTQTLEGQEKGNYKFILDKQVGRGSVIKEIANEIIYLKENPQEYKQLIENIKILKNKINNTVKIEQIIKDIYEKSVDS